MQLNETLVYCLWFLWTLRGRAWKITVRLINLLLSTEIFSKRRKIYSMWRETRDTEAKGEKLFTWQNDFSVQVPTSVNVWSQNWMVWPSGRLVSSRFWASGRLRTIAIWGSKIVLKFCMKKIWNASRICVSSLRRGHANLLCIVPILVYVLREQYTSISSVCI